MKRTRFSPLFLITFSLLLSFATQRNNSHAGESQQPQSAGRTPHLWARTYGTDSFDEMKGHSSLQATSDGGYIVAGATWRKYEDIVIIKLDSDGNIEWQRVYATNQEDKPYGGIHETTDGGYIVVGFTMATVYGTHVVWVLKLTSYGDIEWQRTYGTDYDLDYPFGSNLTSDGGCIISGQTYSYSDDGDIWLVKLDSSGNIEWQRTYGGERRDESADSIHQTNDGGYIFLGSTLSFGAGEWDFLVLKLDSSGDIEWQRTYGGEYTEYANSIQPTRDGGYIVGGKTESFGSGGYDCWILKLSFYGDIEWQRAYGGIGDDENCAAIIEDYDEGYVFAGATNSFGQGGRDHWVVKLDSYGDILWQRTYGSSVNQYSASIQQTLDRSYVFAGFTRSRGPSAEGADILILKLSTEGTIGGSCEIMGSSDAQVTETFVSPSDTNITPINTDVTPQITDVVPEEFTATTNLLCQSSSPLRARVRRPSRRVTPNRP